MHLDTIASMRLTSHLSRFVMATLSTCAVALTGCYDCRWDPELYACVANDMIQIGDNCLARSYPTPEIERHCCPCPVPEACKDEKGYYVDKPIPEDCAQYHENSATGSACSGGTCVSAMPVEQGWSGPVSMMSIWWKEPAGADACPSGAKPVFVGHPAPPPLSCPTCTCDAPEGTCSLPASWTISAGVCAEPGSVTNKFDPPAGWDGSCNNDNAIVEGRMCGGVPCVQSITIAPPTIHETPCAAHAEVPRDEPPKLWDGNPATTPVQLCSDNASLPTCVSEPDKVCAPTAPSSARCYWRHGEHACPTSWSERFVLYEKSEGTRECSCACGPPTGGTCKALVSVWEDAACSSMFHFQATTHAGDQAACHDFGKAGVTLAGQTAEILEYTTGTCTPISGVEDKLTLDGPVTVCCASATVD